MYTSLISSGQVHIVEGGLNKVSWRLPSFVHHYSTIQYIWTMWHILLLQLSYNSNKTWNTSSKPCVHSHMVGTAMSDIASSRVMPPFCISLFSNIVYLNLGLSFHPIELRQMALSHCCGWKKCKSCLWKFIISFSCATKISE